MITITERDVYHPVSDRFHPALMRQLRLERDGVDLWKPREGRSDQRADRRPPSIRRSISRAGHFRRTAG
jgi:hypothetical protein